MESSLRHEFKYERLLRSCPKLRNYERGNPLNVLKRGCQYDVYIGPHPNAELGYGVFALERIPENKAVFEYSGQLLTEKEAREREAVHTPSYMFDLDFDDMPQIKGRPSVIDAHFVGNCSRFLNHSCCPNMEVEKSSSFANQCIRICGVQRIVLVTKDSVAKGEALTIDYHPNWSAKMQTSETKVRCKCGHPNCRKWIPAM